MLSADLMDEYRITTAPVAQERHGAFWVLDRNDPLRELGKPVQDGDEIALLACNGRFLRERTGRFAGVQNEYIADQDSGSPLSLHFSNAASNHSVSRTVRLHGPDDGRLGFRYDQQTESYVLANLGQKADAESFEFVEFGALELYRGLSRLDDKRAEAENQLQTIEQSKAKLNEERDALQQREDDLASQSASLEDEKQALKEARTELQRERQRLEKLDQQIQQHDDRLSAEADALERETEEISERAEELDSREREVTEREEEVEALLSDPEQLLNHLREQVEENKESLEGRLEEARELASYFQQQREALELHHSADEEIAEALPKTDGDIRESLDAIYAQLSKIDEVLKAAIEKREEAATNLRPMGFGDTDGQ